MGTWLNPSHDTLTSRRNFDLHVKRLRAIAGVLAEHNIRFGLEYVAPKTLWASRRYPFIHTMAETKELIAAIGASNVGFVLDSWHWYTAHETREDILSLTNKDVVSVDLNDAPAGVPVDQQIDSVRELPGATGVIDVAAFLNALQTIGYDGPVRPEPFNEALRKMPRDQALSVSLQAMQQAFALLKT
jgi:sugar phosphate isomerase/epimerase